MNTDIFLVLSFFMSEFFVGHSMTSFTYDGIGYRSHSENDWLISSMSKPKCIDIPSNLTLCRGIGYDKMRIPNLLGHDTLNEVIQQSRSWTYLPRIHCHPDTQLFLCSLFSPVCLERTVKPCRSLCESVKAGCESKMNHYGYAWPDMVKCNQFPKEVNLCIPPLHNFTEQNICEPCNQPTTLEGMVDNLCRAEFVARVKIRRIATVAPNKVLSLKKKKKFYKVGSLTKRDRKKLSMIIEGGGSCDCNDIGNRTTTKYIVMGNKTGDGEMILTYIGRWRNDKEFKRALRKIKSFNCSKIVDMIEKPSDNSPSDSDANINTNGSSTSGSGGSRKCRKKTRKGSRRKCKRGRGRQGGKGGRRGKSGRGRGRGGRRRSRQSRRRQNSPSSNGNNVG